MKRLRAFAARLPITVKVPIVVVLLIRPSGLFGSKRVERV